MLSCLLPDPDVVAFSDIEFESPSQSIVCQASSTQTTCKCPICTQPMSRIHSSYQRKLSDLPWAGIRVQLWLRVRRFFCHNYDCCRKIFCERIPTVAAPWARRTKRMAEAQQAIGFAAGGAGGNRLCTALSMDAGVDLLLTLIRNCQQTEHSTPRVLGVDDWAMLKGQTYGTILVDLEAGDIVDVLPDRTAEGLAQWLETHPGVEIVSRDRASAYAEGVRQGAPDAIQVADRWHLLKNLTDAVYKVFQKHQAAIEKMLVQEQSAGRMQEATVEEDAVSGEATEIESFSAADIARQKRVAEAHRLHRTGWTTKAIAVQLGVCAKTVRRYRHIESSVSPLRRSSRKRLLDPYIPYLVKRWNAGCHNAAQLCREIHGQGFSGKVTIVRDFVSQLRKASGLPPRVRNALGTEVELTQTERRPTVRALAHLVGRLPDKLEERDKTFIERLCDVKPELETVIRLAQQFAAMVRQRKVDLLDDWLANAADSLLSSFANGLRQDEDAIRAALSLSWSNGPTEGHINRLKCLKRQMYGRAKLDLLRQRLMAA